MTTPSRSRFNVLGELPALRRYARALTRDGGDAEDLVQDTLVRALERRAQFRAEGNLRGWLLAILHNRFVDATRSRRAEAGRNADAAAALELAAEPGQEHSVRLAEVRRAFFGLPDEQRAALHLVAIEGLSYQAAADALAIPLGTLMSRIGRARAALRESETEGTAARRARLRLIGGPQ